MSDMVHNGRCWIVGDYIPTDQIVKSQRVLSPLDEIARHVLEDVNPRFAREMQAGDVLVAGRHFGQSSGRAIAVKGLKATGVGCVVAESFSRTFYRNAFEIGLPILELPGVTEIVAEGDALTVDVEAGTLRNDSTGTHLAGRPTAPFLLDMLRGGGLIAIGPRLIQESS
jgi:3-isopropylmalate/(R)-2-methylmalate dehydratase small subunit